MWVENIRNATLSSRPVRDGICLWLIPFLPTLGAKRHLSLYVKKLINKAIFKRVTIPPIV